LSSNNNQFFVYALILIEYIIYRAPRTAANGDRGVSKLNILSTEFDNFDIEFRILVFSRISCLGAFSCDDLVPIMLVNC